MPHGFATPERVAKFPDSAKACETSSKRIGHTLASSSISYDKKYLICSKKKLRLQADNDASELSTIDISLPGTRRGLGSIHPLTQLLDKAVRIFRRLGFALADGPDIETEWHCFDALNTPPDHPARNELDTFYLPDGRLLRTHTSTVQIRVMESQTPPVRVIAPGAAYRRDEIDATHLAQFTQLEGLFVDREVSVADLKGTLEFFFRELFGPETSIRFRPHFFPFTEPSYEIDIRYRGAWAKLDGTRRMWARRSSSLRASLRQTR